LSPYKFNYLFPRHDHLGGLILECSNVGSETFGVL
jgi:hypothetical protein